MTILQLYIRSREAFVLRELFGGRRLNAETIQGGRIAYGAGSFERMMIERLDRLRKQKEVMTG